MGSFIIFQPKDVLRISLPFIRLVFLPLNLLFLDRTFWLFCRLQLIGVRIGFYTPFDFSDSVLQLFVSVEELIAVLVLKNLFEFFLKLRVI